MSLMWHILIKPWLYNLLIYRRAADIAGKRSQTQRKLFCLLPTGSETREVFGVGSILFAISYCQDMRNIALYLHNMYIVGL